MQSGDRGISRGVIIAVVIAVIVVPIILAIIVVVLSVDVTSDMGDFKVVYGTITNPAYLKLEQTFRQCHLFEDIADGLNGVLSLPSDIAIAVTEGGEANAWWEPNTNQIVLTYELIAHLRFLPHPYRPKRSWELQSFMPQSSCSPMRWNTR